MNKSVSIAIEIDISVTKDYTNACNGNTNKLFSSGSYHGSNKKQHKIDEKKALMELWKDKLAAAVSTNSNDWLQRCW